jgi:hypothetical protein
MTGTEPTTDDHDCDDFAAHDDPGGYLCVWFCTRCNSTLQVGRRAHPDWGNVDTHKRS